MQFTIISLASLILFSFGSFSPDDCTLDNFVGTWKGKVEFEGDELAQGPYDFFVGADGKSLFFKDNTGAEYELAVNGCDAVNVLEEEGLKSTTTYTYESNELKIHSLVEFPDPDGKMLKMEMKGNMSKVE